MFKKISLILIFVFMFTGCFTTEFPYYSSGDATDFKTPTQKLVLKMNDKLLSIGPRIMGKYIYVVDFVNIKDLNVTSELGPALSSEIKSHISCTYPYRIKELEYMNYFKLNDKGSSILSRNSNDVISEADKTYALVGTYTLTQKQLLLYLKLIDMKTGNILASTSESIEATEEIIQMEKKESSVTLRPHLVL